LKKNRGKLRSKGPIDRTAESAPLRSAAPSSAAGSVLPGIMEQSVELLQPFRFRELMDTPTGARYATKPVTFQPDGMTVAVELLQQFSLENLTGGSGAIMSPSELLARWYPLTRQMGKAALKYKHLPLQLFDPALPQERWEVYHDIVAMLVTMASPERMWQYNEYFASLDDLGWSRRRRNIYQLWREAQTIFAPAALKGLAIKDGLMWHMPPFIAPHMTNWMSLSTNGLTAELSFDEMFGDLSNLDLKLQEIYDAIQWVVYGAATEDDHAIRDLIDMVNDVPGSNGPAYPQGLPKLEEIANIIVSSEHFEEVYLRVHTWAENLGGAGDKDWGFPSLDFADLFGGRIPVALTDAPNMLDFSWFGKAKACTLLYQDANALEFVGSVRPYPSNDVNAADPSGSIFRKNGVGLTTVDFGEDPKLNAAVVGGLLARRGGVLEHAYWQHDVWADLVYTLSTAGLTTPATGYATTLHAHFRKPETSVVAMVPVDDLDANTLDIVAEMFSIPWSGVSAGSPRGASAAAAAESGGDD